MRLRSSRKDQVALISRCSVSISSDSAAIPLSFSKKLVERRNLLICHCQLCVSFLVDFEKKARMQRRHLNFLWRSKNFSSFEVSASQMPPYNQVVDRGSMRVGFTKKTNIYFYAIRFSSVRAASAVYQLCIAAGARTTSATVLRDMREVRDRVSALVVIVVNLVAIDIARLQI